MLGDWGGGPRRRLPVDGTHKGRTALEFATSRGNSLHNEAIAALKKLTNKGFFGAIKGAARSIGQRISPKNRRVSPTRSIQKKGSKGFDIKKKRSGFSFKEPEPVISKKNSQKLKKMMLD